jgi:hypothetical protein
MTMPAPSSLDAQPTSTGNGLAIAALVLGCCSVFFFWLYGIVPVLAIIFGGVSINQAKKLNRKPSGMAVAGLTLGIIFTAIAVLVFAAALAQ